MIRRREAHFADGRDRRSEGDADHQDVRPAELDDANKRQVLMK